MTLSSLERRGVRGQNFLADLHNYTRTVWPRITKFGTVTQVVKKHVSKGSATPTSPKGGPSVPKNFWDSPTYAQTVWPRATKFGTVTHVGHKRVSVGRPRPNPRGPAPPTCLGPLATPKRFNLQRRNLVWNTCEGVACFVVSHVPVLRA